MGFTHNDKLCGVNGLFTGAKGSELQVAATGGLLQSVVLVTSNELVSAGTSCLATTRYLVAPFAGAVTGYVVASVSAATGRTVTVTIGSAGAVLLEAPTAFLTSNGTIGVPVTMTNTSGTTTITAGGSMSVAFASLATAQTVACNVIVTRTA